MQRDESVVERKNVWIFFATLFSVICYNKFSSHKRKKFIDFFLIKRMIFYIKDRNIGFLFYENRNPHRKILFMHNFTLMNSIGKICVGSIWNSPIRIVQRYNLWKHIKWRFTVEATLPQKKKVQTTCIDARDYYSRS